MKQLLFIFNPHTGGGRLKNQLMSILCAYAGAGYEILAHPTTRSGDARLAARTRAPGMDLVVCCGGDGTLNEVVHGLMELEEPPPLGYIPGGTTNDFASSLRLPKTNMLAAAKRTIHPKKLFRCDVGAFNERVFTYVAAFGAFTDISYATPQSFKNVLGYFAYILEAIPRLPNLQARRMRVQCDGLEVEDEFLFGMISNSTSVGGFSFVDRKNVHMDDGRFEMTLIRKPANLAELGGLSAAILTKNGESPLLVSACVEQAVITAGDEVHWTLDGEHGGAPETVEVGVKRQALRICV